MVIKGKRTQRQRLSFPLTIASSSSSAGRSISTSTDNISGGCGSSSLLPSSTTSAEISTRDEQDQDMANCLILLAQGNGYLNTHPKLASEPMPTNCNNKGVVGEYVHECKTCGRRFASFQALGGHRASHKKPKQHINTQETELGLDVKKCGTQEECNYNYNYNYYDSNYATPTLSLQLCDNIACSSKSKFHECFICGAEFASGQALGGHMRRHRTVVSSAATASAQEHKKKQRSVKLKLDLNLPADQVEDDNNTDSEFPFQPKEQVLAYSASSLVDCHY